MTFFRAILISAFCALVSVPVFAGIGSKDTRKYADWSSDQFSRFVTVGSYVGSEKTSWRCTGQYVAPNLILTAAHCYNGKQDIERRDKCYTPLFDKAFTVKVVEMGNYVKGKTDQDYALLLVEDEKYFYPKDNFFEPDRLDSSKTHEPVINAGFGWARIVNDQEIELLRAAFQAKLTENKELAVSDVKSVLDDVMKKNNLKPFREGEAKLKYDSCNVVINVDCWDVCKQYLKYTDGSTELSSKYDEKKCQEICDNRASLYKQNNWPKVLGTTCDSWGGNSGGAYFSRNTGKLISICSYGHDDFDDKEETDYSLSSDMFRQVIDDTRAKYPVKKAIVLADEPELEDCTLAELESLNATSGEKEKGKECVAMLCKEGFHFLEPEKVKCVPDVSSDNATLTGENTDNNESSTVSENYFTDAIQQHTDEVIAIVNNNDNTISSADVLNIINNLTAIEALEEAYKKAKENEKSLKNRLVSGLSMAATGIGGMQLAQGLAEQSADAAAERDMQAYLATFQCTAGGKTYSGGTSGIELAGANQLTGLYQQYVDLASDLKERKAALGMKAGIESEVILDKANTGLYDDVGKGIENGTYASLYRASKGNEKDVNKLAEQKNTSATRVKGGAIAAGAGAVGGAVLGNIDFSSWGSGNASSAFSGLGSALGQAAGGLSGTLGQAAGALSGSGASGIDSSTINSVLQAVGK